MKVDRTVLIPTLLYIVSMAVAYLIHPIFMAIMLGCLILDIVFTFHRYGKNSFTMAGLVYGSVIFVVGLVIFIIRIWN